MTQLATPTKESYPCTYAGFHLFQSQGRLYGIPNFLRLKEVLQRGWLSSHPAILSAATREELEELIDRYDPTPFQPELLGGYEGYHLIRQGVWVYALPPKSGKVDLNFEELWRAAGAIRAATLEELQERIHNLRDAVPIEFAGWLPVYEVSGNCGRHPQFKHTADPPPGYRFTYSAPSNTLGPTHLKKGIDWLYRQICRLVALLLLPVQALLRIVRPGEGCTPLVRLRVVSTLIRLFFALRRNGARLRPILRFLRSRHLQSQFLLGKHRGLVFLTSMPYTYGQNPWILEIEDPTTLFYPLIHNGHTSKILLSESPYFPIVKTLLESDRCKGILTHVRSTASMVATLFDSEIIRAKIGYVPLGVSLPKRWQRHDDEEEDGALHLVFINSWCQDPGNFYVRGGLDVLEAFAILRQRYPRLRLTLRTNLPYLDHHYHRIIEGNWVRLINRFLSPEELEDLLVGSHVFLLPAARIHVVSLLQAMSYGLAVVASDGWGIEEYLEHERNGLIVKGRYGKLSWADEEEGMLREDYAPASRCDRQVIDGLVKAVSALVENPELRRSLGREARLDVATRYTLDNWNRGLKRILDRATGEAQPNSEPDNSPQIFMSRVKLPN